MRLPRLRKGMLPLAILFIASIAAAADSNGSACQSGPNEVGPRVKIMIFQYYGIANANTERIKWFSEFRGFLAQAIEDLSELLSNEDNNKLSYLRSLSLQPPENEIQPEPNSLENTFKVWCDSESLQLLRGNLIEGSSGYQVNSRVFIGDLKGNLPKSNIVVEFSRDKENLRDALESHSLLFLYSLAMDAVENKKDRGAVLKLLARAHDKAAGLQIRNALKPDLRPVAEAVDKAASDINNTR
jgi:hypothetical protein